MTAAGRAGCGKSAPRLLGGGSSLERYVVGGGTLELDDVWWFFGWVVGGVFEARVWAIVAGVSYQTAILVALEVHGGRHNSAACVYVHEGDGRFCVVASNNRGGHTTVKSRQNMYARRLA